MPSLLFVLLLGIAATFVEAQDPMRQPAASQPPQERQPERDGGVGKVTPEERANSPERDASRGASR